MRTTLNIYKEGDKILIQDEILDIELPYTDELWRKLDGERTYDLDNGWLIDGIELNVVIGEETERERENVFVGSIRIDGIDERRELYVVPEGDVFKIVGIAPDHQIVDTDVFSDSIREAIVKTQENWGSDGWDLQLSDEADALLKEMED